MLILSTCIYIYIYIYIRMCVCVCVFYIYAVKYPVSRISRRSEKCLLFLSFTALSSNAASSQLDAPFLHALPTHYIFSMNFHSCKWVSDADAFLACKTKNLITARTASPSRHVQRTSTAGLQYSEKELTGSVTITLQMPIIQSLSM